MMDEARPLRRALVAAGISVATFLGVCWAVTAASPGYGVEEVARETEARRLVERRRPDLVILGNSMVADNVDGELFARLTGVRTSRVYQHGSASAWWYLTLKNDLLAASEPPDVVVLLFRDHFLTHPSFRVLGPFSYRLREHVAWEDPEVFELAYRPALGAMAPLYRDVPLFRNRDDVKARGEGAVKRGLERGLGIPHASADQAIALVFADENLDPAQRTIRQQMAESAELDPALFDFEDRVDASFLPAMIEGARERGVQLVLVRAKKHRRHPHERTAERIDAYGEDLAAYLDAADVPLIDFHDDARILPEHFGWGDHYTDEGRDTFTRLLAGELATRGLLPR